MVIDLYEDGWVIHADLRVTLRRLAALAESPSISAENHIAAAELLVSTERLLRKNARRLKRLGFRLPLPVVTVRPTLEEAIEDGGFAAALGYFARVGEWSAKVEARLQPAANAISDNDDI